MASWGLNHDKVSASICFGVMQTSHILKMSPDFFHVMTDVLEERTAAPPEPDSKARHC